MDAFLNRARGKNEAVFEKDVESPDGTGLQSALSAPIDSISPDEFWDAVEKWMWNKGVIKEMMEQEYTVTKCDDGGVLAKTTYGTSGTFAEMFAGKVVGTTYMKYFVNRENDEMKSFLYNSDETLSKKSLSQESTLKIWRDPFRLEFYIEELEARLSGPLAKAWADAMLKSAGLQLETSCNMDSPSDAGEKSILTNEITDADWTFQKTWENYKAAVIKDYGAQEADENTLVWEWTSLFFTRYYSSQWDGTHIVTRDHGGDETLCECKTEFWQKGLDNPKRIEIWMKNVPYREHGMKAMLVADAILNAILRFARGEAVVSAEISTLVKKQFEQKMEEEAAAKGSAEASG